MSDYFSRQARQFIGNALAPAEAAGTRLFTTVLGIAGLGTVALVCVIATLILLSLALDLWLAAGIGPVLAALATAGFYSVVAGLCLSLAIGFAKSRSQKIVAHPRTAAQKTAAQKTTSQANKPNDADPAAAAAASVHLSENIEETVAPILAILHQFGLQREAIAVRLAAEATKQGGPLALVGIALLAGFLGERALNPGTRNSAKGASGSTGA